MAPPARRTAASWAALVVLALLVSAAPAGAEVGDEIWRFETGSNVYSSPAVAGDTVYVGSNDDHLYALNATDGTERWSFGTGGSVVTSPAVVEGTVYVGSGDGNVYALDAGTGDEEWRFETGDKVRSSPAVAGGTVYVGSNDYHHYALDAETGEEEWRFETGSWVDAAPAVAGGTVYVGSHDGNLYALADDTGEEAWRMETKSGIESAPAVAGGTVYVADRNNRLHALDAAGGDEQWRVEADDFLQSAPTVAEGVVYVGGTEGLDGPGLLHAVDAGTGDEKWRFEADGAVESTPTVLADTVYVGTNDGNVYALDAAEGTESWRFELDESGSGFPIKTSPALADGRLFFGASDQHVYALEVGAVGTGTDADGEDDATSDDSTDENGEETEEPGQRSVVRRVEPDYRDRMDLDTTPDHTIDFKAGHVTPEPGLDPDLEGAEGRTWVVLQFEEEQPRRWIDQLGDGYDITLSEDLTATTVTAGVPAEELEPLADEDVVRAVASVEPPWKRSPTIDAAADDGLVGPNEAARIDVFGFRPLDDPRLRPVGPDDVDMYVGDLTLGDVEDLQEDGDVRWIEHSREPETHLSESRRVVGSPGPDTPATYGGEPAPSGKDVTVGVVDTGFNLSHRHFSDTAIALAQDFVDGDPDPTGLFDHGTHVAGTVAGRTDKGDLDSSDLQLRGVAWEADLVLARGCCNTAATTPTIFDDVDSRGDVDIITNSWGSNTTTGSYTAATELVDDWAEDHGDTLVLFSYGNAPDDRTNAYARGVNVLSVSAVNDGSAFQGAGGARDEPQAIKEGNVVNTANTSPLLTKMPPPQDVAQGEVDQIKPEILAPGEGVHAPINDSGSLSYAVWRGTSMATPHVAGVAALLENATDAQGWDLSADETRALLVESTTPSAGDSGSHYTKGFGVVHAHDAIFNNSYESETGVLDVEEGMNWKDTIGRSFHVPPDATKVTATLSWMDPGLSVSTEGLLKHNLWLFLGPVPELPGTPVPEVWEDSRWVDTSRKNVKKLVFEDPEPGEWRVGAYGEDIHYSDDQPFAVAYSVETEEPGIIAHTPRDPVEVRGEDTRNVTLEVEGTGAPAAGVYATVESLEDPLDECYVGGDDNEWGAVVGTISQDQTHRTSVCLNTSHLPEPGGGASEAYEAVIEVPWVGGSETVTFDVVRVEANPPTNAEKVRSTNHGDAIEDREWIGRPEVRFEWDEASDDEGGIDKYYVALTEDRDDELPLDPKPDYLRREWPGDRHPHSTGTRYTVWLGPPGNPDIPEDRKEYAQETPDAEEAEYWFHVRPRDEAGNLAEATSHYGPIKFDIAPPEAALAFSGDGLRRPDDDLPPVAPVGEPVTLEAGDSTDGGDIHSFEWDVAESSADVSGEDFRRTFVDDDGTSMEVTWEEPGEYDVELIVYDGAFNQDSTTETIIVGDTSGSSEAPGPGALAGLAAGAGAALVRRWRGGRW